MATPRVLVLRAPGTNCDRETAFAFEAVGAATQLCHVNRLREQPNLLNQFQIMCLPGGFSYGDDIAAGRILAGQLRHHLADAIHQFRAAGKLVLGICNGFQMLVKSGILLPDIDGRPQATLTWNTVGRFQDRWVRVKVTNDRCAFMRNGDEMLLPVAHAEGKFVASDEATLRRLDQQGQLVLRYVDEAGGLATTHPANPNGSMASVAGVCDETGRVFGLMPHPERHFDPTHHPRWTRMVTLPEHGDGRRIFENAVQFFA